MLSVGVCDRMSIDTRTVLAEEKKKTISLLHQSWRHASRTWWTKFIFPTPCSLRGWDAHPRCRNLLLSHRCCRDLSTRHLLHLEGKTTRLILQDWVLIKRLRLCVECLPPLRLHPQVRVCHPKCSSSLSGPVWSRHLERTTGLCSARVILVWNLCFQTYLVPGRSSGSFLCPLCLLFM